MINAREEYIPLQSGQSFMTAGQNDIINTLSGYVGYEVKDGHVVMTEDITVSGTKYVDMVLAVADLSKLTDYEPLPIPADIAADVVTEAFQILAKQFPKDTKIDSRTTE